MDKNGNAIAKVDAADLNIIVEKAEKEDTGTILIAPTGTEKAKKVTVELPKSSAANVAKNCDIGVIIQTGVGELELSNETLSVVVKQAKDRDLTVTLERHDPARAQRRGHRHPGADRLHPVPVRQDEGLGRHRFHRPLGVCRRR